MARVHRRVGDFGHQLADDPMIRSWDIRGFLHNPRLLVDSPGDGFDFVLGPSEEGV